MRWCCRLIVVALALTISSVALAQSDSHPPQGDLDAARALANAGMDLYEAGQYELAIERFNSAEALYHAPPHVLILARAHLKLGRLTKAQSYYRRLVDEKLASGAPQPFVQAQLDAAAELKALEARLPTVQIELVGAAAANVVVALDGKTLGAEALGVPLPLNPGQHVASARVAGRPEVVNRFTLAWDEPLQSIELVVGPTAGGAATGGVATGGVTTGGAAPGGGSPDDQDTPSLAGPLVALGIGVAGLGVGAITGILALNDASELKDNCPNNPCSEEHEHLADSVHALGTTSTVAFVVGGAAVAAGLILLLSQSDGDSAEQQGAMVEPLIGPLCVGLRGRF